jgi:hypothetical protein
LLDDTALASPPKYAFTAAKPVSSLNEEVTMILVHHF